MKRHFNFDKPENKKRRAKKQEEEWANLVNGKRQPNSGAYWGAKGDVREKIEGILEEFLWENKYTTYKSYRITIDTWKKIRQEAYEQGNIPGMEIEIDPKGTTDELELVVMEKEDYKHFKAMIEKAQKNNNEGEG